MLEIEEKIIEDIIQAGCFLDQKKLCPATSGNLSVYLDKNKIMITISGKHKGYLTKEDIIVVNHKGHPQNSHVKPSAETLLHTSLYQLYSDVGAVIHTHSMDGTVLSMLLNETHFVTKGYELHKVFPGIVTHQSEITTPIFENSQDMKKLSQEIKMYLHKNPNTFGYFLRGHGLYTWGKDMHEAKMRVEAYEFLFACELKRRQLK